MLIEIFVIFVSVARKMLGEQLSIGHDRFLPSVRSTNTRAVRHWWDGPGSTV
jgi:hypothetical protein